MGTSEPLNLKNVIFENCSHGILNQGGRIEYDSGSMGGAQINGQYLQLRHAITGIDAQGNSFISRLNVGYDHYASTVLFPLASWERSRNLLVHGNGGYYMYKSTVQNADHGVQMDQGRFFPICSEFLNNDMQFMHTHYSLLNASRGGWNAVHWSGSPTGLRTAWFGYNAYLYLDKGINRIMGHDNGNAFIYGILPGDHLRTSSTDNPQWSAFAISATDNQWQISTGVRTNPAPNFNAHLESGAFVSTLTDINKQPYNNYNWDEAKTSYCGTFKTPLDTLGPIGLEQDSFWMENHDGDELVEWRLPVRPKQIKDMLNAAGGDGEKLHGQLLRALNLVEASPRNYSNLIDSFSNIFNQPLPDTLAAPIKHVYSLLHDIYLEIRTDHTVSNESREELEAEVYAKMLAMQESLLEHSTDSTIWRFAQFELTRDYALIHRIFNARPIAKTFLENTIALWSDSMEKQALQDWLCIITKEQQYLDSQITYDELELQACLTPFFEDEFNEQSMVAPLESNLPMEVQKYLNGDVKKDAENAESPAKTHDILLYPNPTENKVYIGSPAGIAQITIHDLNGRLLWNSGFNKNQQPPITLYTVDVSTLPRGLYLVEIKTATTRKMEKLVINR